MQNMKSGPLKDNGLPLRSLNLRHLNFCCKREKEFKFIVECLQVDSTFAKDIVSKLTFSLPDIAKFLFQL